MTDRIKAIATGTIFGGLVDCYVLANEKRVVSQRGALRALTGGAAGSKDLGRGLARLPSRFAHLTSPPAFEFDLPGGGVALGRDAQWFVDVLKAYKSAWRAGEIVQPSQVKLAKNADAILDALAGVAIVALIDEATGYQALREFDVLSRLFERTLRNEASERRRLWEDGVVDSLCKTYRITRAGHELPAPLMGVIGWIYKLVLGKEVHAEMKRRNPRGVDRAMHHQWFRDELRALVEDDLRIIKALSDTSGSKVEFKRRMLSHYRNVPFQLGFGGAS
jgi:hypothetical protein